MDDTASRLSLQKVGGAELIGEFEPAIFERGDSDSPLTFAQAHERVSARYYNAHNDASDFENECASEDGSESGEEE